MDLKELLALSPRLNVDGDGNAVSYRLGKSVLQYLDGILGSSQSTLETGTGVSTVLFAMKRTKHTCITTNRLEVDGTAGFCKEHEIPLDKVRFIIGRSEYVLPSLESSGLDVVLIDGRHAFPTPFIDWFYTADKLRVGGLLIVDDVEMWTGRTLMDFLSKEPEWRRERFFMPNSVVFKKLAGGSNDKVWAKQPYLRRFSLFRTAANVKKRLLKRP